MMSLLSKIKKPEKSTEELKKELESLENEVKVREERKELLKKIEENKMKLGKGNKRQQLQSGILKVQQMAKEISKHQPNWDILMEDPLTHKKVNLPNQKNN